MTQGNIEVEVDGVKVVAEVEQTGTDEEYGTVYTIRTTWFDYEIGAAQLPSGKWMNLETGYDQYSTIEELIHDAVLSEWSW